MQLPDNAGLTARYLSLAPDTTAQFFRLNPEMQGPVANLCALLGRYFPDTQISMTAVHSFEQEELMLVIGVSTPLNEQSAGIVDQIMAGYFQPLMDKIDSDQRVLVAIGENLGSHSTQFNASKPIEVLAGIDDRLDRLAEAGPLGSLMASSLPLYERGCGNDLQRVFKAANKEVPLSSN